jgi:hypothetical protein
MDTLSTISKTFENGEILPAGELNKIVASINSIIGEVNNRKEFLEEVIGSLNSAVERIGDIEEILNNQEESNSEVKNLFTGVLTGRGWKSASTEF